MEFVRNEVRNGISVGIHEHEGKEIVGPRMLKEMPKSSPKDLYDAGMITFAEYRKQGHIFGLPITQIEQMQGSGRLKANV